MRRHAYQLMIGMDVSQYVCVFRYVSEARERRIQKALYKAHTFEEAQQVVNSLVVTPMIGMVDFVAAIYQEARASLN